MGMLVAVMMQSLASIPCLEILLAGANPYDSAGDARSGSSSRHLSKANRLPGFFGTNSRQLSCVRCSNAATAANLAGFDQAGVPWLLRARMMPRKNFNVSVSAACTHSATAEGNGVGITSAVGQLAWQPCLVKNAACFLLFFFQVRKIPCKKAV